MDYKQKLNELLLITASRIKFITTVAFIILSGSFFIFHNINAQEIPNLPGAIEGEGIFFKITDSEYLNISTNSSESIKIRMESIPEMVTITIEPSASSTALLTQITLTGFNPLTTYYKYEDDYHNLTKFTTDENGSYSYTQDISQLHFIFIQPRKSTKFIKDDATDCAMSYYL